ASGSHVCKGNWPDFATAPKKINRVIHVRTSGGISPASKTAKICAQSKLPVWIKRSITAINKPISPIRVMIKAFLAARFASGLKYQKPIRRKEQTPTNSQKIYIWSRLGEITSPNMEKVNKPR